MNPGDTDESVVSLVYITREGMKFPHKEHKSAPHFWVNVVKKN